MNQAHRPRIEKARLTDEARPGEGRLCADWDEKSFIQPSPTHQEELPSLCACCIYGRQAGLRAACCSPCDRIPSPDFRNPHSSAISLEQALREKQRKLQRPSPSGCQTSSDMFRGTECSRRCTALPATSCHSGRHKTRNFWSLLAFRLLSPCRQRRLLGGPLDAQTTQVVYLEARTP